MDMNMDRNMKVDMNVDTNMNMDINMNVFERKIFNIEYQITPVPG
jgi:hypothetical protein